MKKKLNSERIKEKLIAAGVKNLKEFGYPAVDEENILVDMVYSMMFKSMLRENLGFGFDKEINELLGEIKNEDN